MEERNQKVINLKTASGDTERAPFSKTTHYRPDDELIQSTARIKNQRDLILNRIQKMELAHERVKESVYSKVKRDYTLQLQTISELLNEKKDTLKKEIKDLYLRREKLTMEVNRHREILEEAEFRHFLGEFTQSQFQEVESYETKEIEKLEGDLSHIGEFVKMHEDLFDPEDLGGIAPRQQAGEVTKTAMRPQPHGAPAKPAQRATPTSPQPQPKRAEQAPVVDEDEVSEFEALFMDDEDQEPAASAGQENSIKSIIEEASRPTKSSTTSKNVDNYFGGNKLDASVTEKKQTHVEPGTSDELTPGPQKAESSKTQIDSNSISEILDSIKVTDTQADGKEIPLEETQNQTGQNYYLQLTEGDLEQKEFALKENTSIGRSSANDIPLKAPKVSRQHAAINLYNNQYILIDLKSSNGVYVNGAKVDECVLNNGDEISVGGYKFLFLKKQ